MLNKKNKKKAQALPLNTVVIAILVVIVLIVIIVMFTKSVNKSDGSIDDTQSGIVGCKLGTLGISEDEYSDVKFREKKCEKGEDRKNLALTGDDEKPVCCAIKIKQTSTGNNNNDDSDKKDDSGDKK